LAKDAGLSNGLNVHDGRLTHHAVASALGSTTGIPRRVLSRRVTFRAA